MTDYGSYKHTKITIDVDERLALKSGFLRELLKAVEDINHKYYDETFSAYGCNVAQVEVVINGKVAISEEYGVR